MSNGAIKKFIYQKEAPYLFTIFFIVLGWILVHITTRLLSAPIIEYSSCGTPKGNITEYNCELINISRDKLFRSLLFDIILKDAPATKSKIVKCIPLYHPPLLRQINLVDKGDEYATFTVSELHPFWKVEFRVQVSGRSKPSIRLSTNGKGVVPVRLVESSFSTFLVKNEFWVLIVLVVLWIIVMSIYIHYYNKAISNPPKGDQGKPDPLPGDQSVPKPPPKDKAEVPKD